MCSILIERHRVSCAPIHLGATTLDLGVPGFRRTWLGLTVESSQELESQLRSLLDRQAKEVLECVGRSKPSKASALGTWRLAHNDRNVG